MNTLPNMSVAIATYGREQVLVETIARVLECRAAATEVLIADQTPRHEPETERRLADWQREGRIRWLRLPEPSTVDAMNACLQQAATPLVLFLDDDVIPSPDLLSAHAAAHAAHPEALAVVGQVLQPGEVSEDVAYAGPTTGLRADLEFPFRSARGAWVQNVIGCNLSVKRAAALSIGGFDANFTPPVAFRFETEFARRAIARGYRVWFEPSASIRHLRAPSGGTRTHGSHLTSASPEHGVGDYYFALRCGSGWERWRYMAIRPLRQVRTRFHLRNPWYIPVKLVGELRALALGLKLWRRGVNRLTGPGT
jgi:GT2 family glycosyltransferase